MCVSVRKHVHDACLARWCLPSSKRLCFNSGIKDLLCQYLTSTQQGGERTATNLRPTRFSDWVPGQVVLHIKSLSQNETSKQARKGEAATTLEREVFFEQISSNSALEAGSCGRACGHCLPPCPRSPGRWGSYCSFWSGEEGGCHHHCYFFSFSWNLKIKSKNNQLRCLQTVQL